MELAFVIDAVRRYWWVVVLGAVLGGAAGFLVQSGGGSQYQSMAVLLLIPPSEDPLSVSGDTERYVANQLAVLSSTDLSEQVADALNAPPPADAQATDPEATDEGASGDAGDDEAAQAAEEWEAPDPEYTAAEVKGAINFIHIPETDIVQIMAEHPSPVRAEAIANGYLDQYFVRLEDEVTSGQEDERPRLQAILTPLEDALEEVNGEIQAAMRTAINNAGAGTPPEPESVVPVQASRRAQLELQIAQVSEALTALDLQGPLQVGSIKVQRGDLPDSPVTATSKVLIAAGLVGGAFVGLLAAVLLARLSPRLLGTRHAEEILGQPLVGAMPGDPALAGGPVAALGTLPPDVREFADLVSVRAEASSQSGSGSLVVAVIGSERGAGTTTLAAAMANRFAAHGSEVLLVDADSRDRWLSRQLAPGPPGIAELMALAPTIPNLRDKADPDLKQCLRPTAIPNVRVLGAGDSEAASLRRQNVSTIIAITSRTADVVVFDAGALMEASATVQLAHLADAVVLAIPDRQQAAALETVTRQLRGRRGTLLAVWSGSIRRESNAGPRSEPPTEEPPGPDPFEQAEQQWQAGGAVSARP